MDGDGGGRRLGGRPRTDPWTDTHRGAPAPTPTNDTNDAANDTPPPTHRPTHRSPSATTDSPSSAANGGPPQHGGAHTDDRCAHHGDGGVMHDGRYPPPRTPLAGELAPPQQPRPRLYPTLDHPHHDQPHHAGPQLDHPAVGAGAGTDTDRHDAYPNFHPEDFTEEPKAAPPIVAPPQPSAPPFGSATADGGGGGGGGGAVRAPPAGPPGGHPVPPAAHADDGNRHQHHHHHQQHGAPRDAADTRGPPGQRHRTDRERFEEAQAGRADGGEMECPVCIDTIPSQEMAMRCAGDGGRPHYFHSACLQEWARTCNTNMQAVRCPVCRGAIQVHAERLQTLLADPVQTQRLDPADRSFLEHIAAQATQLGTAAGWADLETVLTAENLTAAVGMMGAFGHGFWVATRTTYAPLSDELMHHAFERMTPQATVAHLVGLAVGFTFRLASTAAASNDRDEARRRDGDGRSEGRRRRHR